MSDALHAAIAARDLKRVIAIYTEAADRREAEGDIDSACFLLTHAWVHALEADDREAGKLRARLIAHGRERNT